MKGLKKSARKSGLRAVLIRWVDSGGSDGWCMMPDDNPTPIEILTLGWLIDEAENHLTVSACVADIKGDSEHSNAPIAIPRAAIIEWRFVCGCASEA